MGKIVLLVPRVEMVYLAHNIQQEKDYGITDIRVIQTNDAVSEARAAISDGASVLIARGLQASLIKQYTAVPVVEITVTAQEMALLIVKAKEIVKKERPLIAVAGFENTFCDMSYFDSIYGIDLRTYYISSHGESLEDTVRQAVKDKVDLIIGGDTAVEEAAKAGIPSLFISATEDSMKNAFSMAKSVDYAINVEKKNAAQIETLLDYSFNGIVQLDAERKISSVNLMMQDILGKKEEELIGKSVRMLSRDLGEEGLNEVYVQGKEHALFMQVNDVSMFAVLAPVKVGGNVESAVLTCHKMMKKNTVRRKLETGKENAAPFAVTRFEDIVQKSDVMKKTVSLAKLYSLSESPVFITGETGTEMREIAQSIHNCSLRSERPFVEADLASIGPEERREKIFGANGAAEEADQGTLSLLHAETADSGIMQGLKPLLRKHTVRLIISSAAPLPDLLAEEKLTEDMYYCLNSLILKIPPLKERKEDLVFIMEQEIRSACERYGRFHVLTAGARNTMMDYEWPGNIDQVKAFCERLILTAEHRSIDEVAVRNLLNVLYPSVQENGRRHDGTQSGSGRERTETGKMVSYAEQEAEKIRRILAENGGSRRKTAAMLGISKPTLWRRMQKYGIGKKE